MTFKNDTMNYDFKDYRDEDGLNGVVLVHDKKDGKWIGVFRYELEQEQGINQLITKVAKFIPLDPMIAFDEQFKYEFSYFTKELFPKTFSGLKFSIPQKMNFSVKGHYTQPKLDDNGKPILDDKGNPIMEQKPFETIN